MERLIFRTGRNISSVLCLGGKIESLVSGDTDTVIAKCLEKMEKLL